MNDLYFLAGAFCFYVLALPFFAILLAKEESRRVERLASLILLSGFVLHCASLAARTAASKHEPFTNLYESLVFFSWTLSFAFLLFLRRFRIQRLGFFSALISVGFILYALLLEPVIRPLAPALQSPWLMLHVSSNFFAYGIFALSFCASVIFLTPFQKKIVREEILEEWIYQMILWGFPFLTLGIFAGAVWAYQAWGVYWNWDPKETWALITWCVYALYLHLRAQKICGRRVLVKAAFFAFLCVMFTYLGVGLLLPGLHGYMK